jgi:RimJ/RimL family protein N-acetyltransferase
MRSMPAPSDVPPGYPREYERRLRLLDGRTVSIRPVVPDDAVELADAIRTADPDTLRRRFLGGPPRVTPALLERLTTLDYVRRFALAAFDDRTGRGVAITRYETTGEGVAEVAAAVDPAWRRIGLATAMVKLLAQAALDRGIHEFTASYLAVNRPVAALLALTGGADQQLIEHGIGEAAVDLDREQVEAAVRAQDTAVGSRRLTPRQPPSRRGEVP